MRLLVLGGSIFVGHHIVQAALLRGHDVTMMTRGRHAVATNERVEHIVCDRRGDLACLTGRQWDAVIDTSGYRPEVVRASTAALRTSADHYVFISSASVYLDYSEPRLSEDAEVSPTWEREISPRDSVGYGRLKAACEIEAELAFPKNVSILRPGLIVGPGDTAERFGYWPMRLTKPGPILAPRPANAPIQFVDVRDHANFVLKVCEEGLMGTYNVMTPPGMLTIQDILSTCAAGAGRDGIPDVVWAAPSLLESYFVRPWTELPLWVGTEPAQRYMMDLSSDRAIAAGLIHRPLLETVRDTLNWELARGIAFPRAGQLKSMKEQLLVHVARG